MLWALIATVKRAVPECTSIETFAIQTISFLSKPTTSMITITDMGRDGILQKGDFAYQKYD